MPHYTLTEWINLQTQGNEKLTVVHFAAFRGNIDMLRLLIKHGANIRAKNHQGMNAVHMATQG